MEVFEAIQKRYSCRSWQDRPIESDKLTRVLDAARLAPSARNFQDWRFVVVQDQSLRTQLIEAANNQEFVGNAPTIIVACSNSDYVMRCGQAIAPIDVSIALEHIALQATAEGLATCWIGSFFPEKVRPILGIPDNIEIIELMPIGYPADACPPKKRQPLEEIAAFNKWTFENTE
jgi:nitroreductase